MLPLAAFLFAQVEKPGAGDAFIAECAKAVAAIKEGTWRSEIVAGGQSQVVEVILKGDRSLCRTFVDGKPYVDVALTPASALYVIYPNRQYVATQFPAPSAKKDPEPLSPLEYGAFEYKLEIPIGFVLKANPTWTEVKIGREKDLETLRAKSVKKEGGTLDVKLARDPKSKLPKILTYATKDGEATVRFDCKPRAVKDGELTIAPSAYAGFEKVEAPSGTL